MSLLKWALIFLVLGGFSRPVRLHGDRSRCRGHLQVLFIIFLVVFAIIGILALTAFRAVT